MHDAAGSAVEAAVFLRKIYPGISAALFYPDDPEFWHEAIVLYAGPDKTHFILTPDWDDTTRT